MINETKRVTETLRLEMTMKCLWTRNRWRRTSCPYRRHLMRKQRKRRMYWNKDVLCPPLLWHHDISGDWSVENEESKEAEKSCCLDVGLRKRDYFSERNLGSSGQECPSDRRQQWMVCYWISDLLDAVFFAVDFPCRLEHPSELELHAVDWRLLSSF